MLPTLTTIDLAPQIIAIYVLSQCSNNDGKAQLPMPRPHLKLPLHCTPCAGGWLEASGSNRVALQIVALQEFAAASGCTLERKAASAADAGLHLARLLLHTFLAALAASSAVPVRTHCLRQRLLLLLLLLQEAAAAPSRWQSFIWPKRPSALLHGVCLHWHNLQSSQQEHCVSYQL
jgi:hypothetical protein